MESRLKKWRRPKPPKSDPDDSRDLVVIITEDNATTYGYNFPQSRTISPFDKFWQEHRHEEKDEAARKRMDESMKKYV